jgi:protein-tyrosine phosphatase
MDDEGLGALMAAAGMAPAPVDPTRIEVQLDPSTMEYHGVAAHGNTPFSTTLISKITDDLYQGGCMNGLVLPDEIKNLVSLYPWERYLLHHDVHSFLEVKMYDSLDQSFDQVVEIARWVNAGRKDGPTLVHCQAGLNRSSLVACVALILDGMKSDDAVALLREKRSPACLCNPAFEKLVLAFEA